MREYKISVAMATYNGEKYIEEQLRTILDNLLPQDEVIISDDGSTDRTRELIASFEDSRITLVDGPKNGVKQNFGNAISRCTGRYLFLADQDDIWAPDKVMRVLAAFETEHCTCVQHDCSLINDETGKTIVDSYFAFRHCGPGVWKNIYKCTYLGCAMAFDAKLVPAILPIPNDIDMHDQWIGILSDRFGKTVFLSDKLIQYRRHEGTASDCFHHHSFGVMLRDRIHLIRQYRRRKKSCKKQSLLTK